MKVSIDETKVKLAWREKYITEGANQRALALPRGVYRGYWPAPRLAPDEWLKLYIDPGALGLDIDQFAVYADRAAGFSVSVRETTDVEFDCGPMGGGLFPAGAAPETWYVYIRATYASNTATEAYYCVEKVDPHDPLSGPLYYPNAVILCTIAIPALAPDFTAPGVAFNYVLRRMTPTPTAHRDAADFGAGDELWGLWDGLSKWRTPTVNEKEAMDNALTPATGANPFVTVADIVPFATRVLGEPVLANLSGGGTDFVDLPTGPLIFYYVGTGGAATATYYFDPHTNASPFPLVTATQREVRVASVHKFVAGVETVLTPSADADANGFFYCPDANNKIRLYFAYEDGTSATLAFGAPFDVWCNVKNWLSTLAQTPAAALPMASRPRWAHAGEHLVRIYDNPPRSPRSLFSTAGTAIRALQELNRGTAFKGMTDEDVCANAAWDSREPDLYPYNGTNTFGVEPTIFGRRCLAYCHKPGFPMERGVFSSFVAFLLFIPACQRLDPDSGTILTPAAAVPDGPGGNWLGWNISAMCSDGPWLYIRLYNPTSKGHRVTCVDPFTTYLDGGITYMTRNPAWPATGCDLGTGELVGWTGFGFAEDLIVASGTRLAANRPWVDIDTAADNAIEIINKATGVKLIHGKGDMPVAPIGVSTFAAGPMCSDGLNVYYSIYVADGTRMGVGIRQCTIADPTLSNTAAWEVLRYVTFMSGFMVRPRSLVYDGFYVWQNVTSYSGDEPSWIVATQPRWDTADAPPMYYDFDVVWTAPRIGPAVFDGKHLYFGVSHMASMLGQGVFQMLRVDPARIDYGVQFGANDPDRVIVSRWSARQQEAATFYGDTPWGPMVTDGQDLFFFTEFDPSCVEPGWGDDYPERLMRIPMIRWRQ